MDAEIVAVFNTKCVVFDINDEKVNIHHEELPRSCTQTDLMLGER